MNFYLIIRSLTNRGAYKLIAYSVLFITIIYCVLQFQLITLNEQFISEKKTEKKINKISLSSQVVKEEKPNNILSLQGISLPKPPFIASTESLKKLNELNEKTTALLLNPVHKKQFEPNKVKLIKNEPPKNQNEKDKIKKKYTKENNHTNTSKNTKRIYQQLTSLSKVSVEVAWPKTHGHYQNVLAYLEQCLGIGFGLIQGDELRVLLPLKNKVAMSSWLREVNGNLTVNEQRLLINQFSFKQSSQEPAIKQVRLFPQSFDLRLAQLISQNLVREQKQQTGQKLNTLESLYAHFQLNKQQGSQSLMLVDIKLNNTPIKNTWLLHQSTCQ